MVKRKSARIAIVCALALAMATPYVTPSVSSSAVAQAAAAVKISKSQLTLAVGKTATLKISGTTKSAAWTTSNKSVAKVTAKGKVTAVAAGTATITATVNNKKYTCKVTVKATETTVYGEVTKISGTKITLALGTMNTPGGNPPSGSPAGDSGTTSQNSTASGVSGSDNSQGGTAPGGLPAAGGESAPGAGGEGSGPLTLNGKSVTITISDTGILSKESMQAPGDQSSADSTTASIEVSLSDISVGSILKVTYKNSVKNLVSVQIMSFGNSGGNPPGGNGGETTVTNGTSAYTLTEGEAVSDGTYSSTNADENALRADSVTATLNNPAVSKTAGAASSNDASSFYGLNAAILTLGNAILNLTGGSVTASAEGATGVFAYGKSVINIADTVINVTGGNAGGIEVAGGGTINATNLTVNSKVKAAIRSDRGGGTITVNGGTYTTSGSTGAPAIYSTADITVNNAILRSETSEAVVVEGLNSVTLNNSVVVGNMSGTYGSNSGENIHNVMLYQSMSGDAETGNSSFTMTGGSLTSKNGDMFYVTNTDSDINLTGVALTLAEGTKLLTVAGNDGSRGWGKAGSNGGICIFNASGQALTGDISVDTISKLTMSLNSFSTYIGAVNSDGTKAAALSVTLDSNSTWTLTADSYVTEFNGSLSNVATNGHTLYINGVAAN